MDMLMQEIDRAIMLAKNKPRKKTKKKTGKFEKYEMATYLSGIYWSDLESNTDIKLDEWYTHPDVLDDDGERIPFLLERWAGVSTNLHENAREFSIIFREMATPEDGDRKTFDTYIKITKLLKKLIGKKNLGHP